jgi:hypothetical protein
VRHMNKPVVLPVWFYKIQVLQNKIDDRRDVIAGCREQRVKGKGVRSRG